MLHPSISGWFSPIRAGRLLPLHFNFPCPWDFINIISSSGAADMEQRAAINNSSLVLAPCLGIHTTGSLLCRFGAVHDPKTSLSYSESVCVFNSSSVKVSLCVYLVLRSFPVFYVHLWSLCRKVFFFRLLCLFLCLVLIIFFVAIFCLRQKCKIDLIWNLSLPQKGCFKDFLSLFIHNLLSP